MTKLNFTLAILLSIITVSACKKDEQTDNKYQQLIGKKWKIVSITEDGKEVLMSKFTSCIIDDYFEFSPNNTYSNNEGSSKCNPDDPQVKDVGSWSIAGDVLYMQSNTLPVKSSVNIKELTSSKMVLLHTNYSANSIEIKTYVPE